MNLSIRGKLLIGFSIIVALLLIAGIIMTRSLSQTRDNLKELVDVSSEKIILSNEILVLVLNASRYEKNMILTSDMAEKIQFRNQLYEALESIDRRIPELETIMGETGKSDVQRFNETWNGYESSIQTIVELSMNNETEKAIEFTVGEGHQVRDKATGILTGIIERHEAGMDADKLQSEENYQRSRNLILILIITGCLLSVLISFSIISGISRRISFISKEAEKIASRTFQSGSFVDNQNDELSPIIDSLNNIGTSFEEVTESAYAVASGQFNLEIVPRSADDRLGNALKKMTVSLKMTTRENEQLNWLTSGINKLNEALRGDKTIEELSTDVIAFLSRYVDANIGALYIQQEQNKELVLTGKFAFATGDSAKTTFTYGEGLVGQAASEQQPVLLSNITENQPSIITSVLEIAPAHLMAIPFLFEGQTRGVIELGRMTPFTHVEQNFLFTCMESIGIGMNSAMVRSQVQELLEETQMQQEELQTQQEELKQSNEELEEQAHNLKQQQEELQMTNEELEEQTQALEAKNQEIEAVRQSIEQKTIQLELSSKYKSEFLSNMSHELRTPLNSLLILSKDLADNKANNLVEDQVESANIIYKCGHDLLNLINEVLDLSKIEAGKMSLRVERVPVREITKELNGEFMPQAKNKSLQLNISVEEQLPEFILTDRQRLMQILRNLLSNALKFTRKGSITLQVKKVAPNRIAFSVADTGIGIPRAKHQTVFEAFQQADGSTSRKYGGTGLGLSISRELSKLLQGEINLRSEENRGSEFTLTIPEVLIHSAQNTEVSPSPVEKNLPLENESELNTDFRNYNSLEDDREIIEPGDKVILIIEDDMSFARILYDQAHEKGFRCLCAATGEDGIWLAKEYRPQAIILDVVLPGINGDRVLRELKSHADTRHIPVHIMSVEEHTLDFIKEGAIEYFIKPVDKGQLDEAFARIEHFLSRKIKNLLIIEDDLNARKAICKLIGNGDVKCIEAGTGSEALEILQHQDIDCIVLDIGLPDITGFELIKKIGDNSTSIPPIIVYTGRELTREENEELHKYAESIIIKGVKSEERLLDETALFLHRTIKNLPESKKQLINSLYDHDKIFKDRKILVVDDDMRNVFALSKILSERGMKVIKADNGMNALEMLGKHPDTEMVLMDIMMPEMDGYEATRRIRKMDQFNNIPIIALTAKAMKDDRQKCIDAGANDYISKPVDVNRLLSLMQVWISA